MPNDLKFQEGQVPIDNNLRPVKVDDIPSALELSTDKVRVKVLEIIDELETLRVGSIVTEGDAINFYRQLAHLATFENNTIKFHSGTADVFELATSLSKLIIRDILNTSDYFQIDVGTNGATTISTVDDDAASAGLTLSADGEINIDSGTSRGLILDSGDKVEIDSHSGEFVAKKAGTEFSVANSAFAGMLLGYTTVGIDAADDSYTLSSTMTCLDDALKVKFVAPPSGAVEIFAQIYLDASRRAVAVGLSDQNETTGYAAIDFPNSADPTNEHVVSLPPSASGDSVLQPHWVVTGLTPGTAYEWWFAAKTTIGTGGVLRWGGNATNKYPPFIMKATALPTAVADYAVYG
tara:strand:- start:971 stop:2020 length:1050 start_codon:yes stop_codon:yes gene_type:complete